jgi:hypothetical protein
MFQCILTRCKKCATEAMIAVECRTGDLFNGLVPGCQFFESNKLYLLFCEKCACNLSKPQKVSKIPLAERIENFANPPFSFFFLTLPWILTSDRGR